MELVSNVLPLIRQRLKIESSLSDLPKCNICSDTGFETRPQGVRVCECRRQRMRESELAKIPPGFRDFRLETITGKGHAMQQKVIHAMRKDPTSSFFLAGDFGCGKSLLLWTLYRHALEAGGRKIVACTLTQLLNEYKALIQASRVGDDPVPPQLCSTELKQSECQYSIFLDDIDKARPTEYAAEQFFEIVNAIYDFQHQVVVTTNLGVQALTEHFNRADPRFGGAIVRRLVDNAKVVEMF